MLKILGTIQKNTSKNGPEALCEVAQRSSPAWIPSHTAHNWVSTFHRKRKMSISQFYSESWLSSQKKGLCYIMHLLN